MRSIFAAQSAFAGHAGSALAIVLTSLVALGCGSTSSPSTAGTDAGATPAADGATPKADAATSSGGIGGETASCPGMAGGTPDTPACVACQKTHCTAEMQVVSGTDPSKFAGACEAFFGCICACSPEDSTCAFGCIGLSRGACETASQALGTCVQAHCKALCPAP